LCRGHFINEEEEMKTTEGAGELLVKAFDHLTRARKLVNAASKITAPLGLQFFMSVSTDRVFGIDKEKDREELRRQEEYGETMRRLEERRPYGTD
jgi:hypothetical protein